MYLFFSLKILHLLGFFKRLGAAPRPEQDALWIEELDFLGPEEFGVEALSFNGEALELGPGHDVGHELLISFCLSLVHCEVEHALHGNALHLCPSLGDCIVVHCNRLMHRSGFRT